MKVIDDYILDKNLKVKNEFIDPNCKRDEDLDYIISYLQNGNGYVAISSPWECEFCSGLYSRVYKTDGKWLWGDWMLHYIENHKLTLPIDFLEDIRRVSYKCPQLTKSQIKSLIDGEIDEIPY